MYVHGRCKVLAGDGLRGARLDSLMCVALKIDPLNCTAVAWPDLGYAQFRTAAKRAFLESPPPILWNNELKLCNVL